MTPYQIKVAWLYFQERLISAMPARQPPVPPRGGSRRDPALEFPRTAPCIEFQTVADAQLRALRSQYIPAARSCGLAAIPANMSLHLYRTSSDRDGQG